MPTVTISNKDGEVLESHNISGSFLSWIKETCKSEGVEYRDSIRPPYSAKLNGEHWPYSDHDAQLNEDDYIMVTIEPRGVIAAAAVSLVGVLYYSYTALSDLDSGYQDSAGRDGSSIYAANTNANTISPSGIIREMAGEQHIYPDLICPPRKKYIDNQEFLYLNLCLTRGFADIDPSNLYIAETPVEYYAGDIDYSINDPGEDVSGHEAHENWFQSKEVSGLKLTTEKGVVGGSWSVDASGDEFTSYLNGVATDFPFSATEHFEIVSGGGNPGLYQVVSISGASNEVAQVVEVQYAGGDTGRLEIISQRTSGGIGRQGEYGSIRRAIFENETVPVLSPVTGSAIRQWKGVNGGINWEGPFLAVPPNETARYGEFDIRFPQGLVELDNENNQTDKFVRVVIRWRDRGTAQWTNELVDTTSDTFDEIGKTILIDYGSEITPEVMFRRVTNDSDDISISDVVQIQRVKHKLESPTSYPDITTIQMRIRGTNALSQTAENKINVRGASRKLPTLEEIEDAANGTPFDLGGDKNVDVTWQLPYRQFKTIGNLEDYTDEITTNVYRGFDFSEDGLHFVMPGTQEILSFTLDVPYDLRTMQYNGRYSNISYYPSVSNNFTVKWLDSGAKMAVVGFESPTDRVAIYDLAEDYDISSATLGSIYSNPFSHYKAFFNDNGEQYWLTDGREISELTMSTAFDASTTSFTGDTFDTTTDLGSEILEDIFFGDSYSKLYVLSSASRVYSYTLSTPGDITTATIDSPAYVDISDDYFSILPAGIFVDSDKFYFLHTYSEMIEFTIPATVNVRRSRSVARFVANAIYDSIGADVLEQVDFDALDTLDGLLESREDYLDAEFLDETTLWDAVKIMSAVGYSEPVIKEGVLELIRTVEGTDFTNLYTPDVMLGDGLQVDMSFYGSQEPDGVDIEYFSLETYSNEVYQYRLAGDMGLNPKKIQSIGIGTEEKAFRMAARERRRLRAKPSTYTFTTEMDGLNSNYGDPIAIASDIFGGQYGLVSDVSGSVVTLDFEPEVGADVATFRNPEGTKSSTHSITLGPGSNEITLVSPSTPDFTLITDENQQANLATIGSSDNYIKRAIVKRLEPTSDNEVQVTAEEYVADIYADDDETPS
jgi:hypothetical protein